MVVGIIVFLVILVICYGISFGITGLIIKGICWAFGFAFSWKLAFGIWLILALVGSVFGGTKYVKKVN